MKKEVPINILRHAGSILLLIAWWSASVSNLYAQHFNVWAFGGKAGIDFNGGTPTAITTAMNTLEGCASVCDAQGQLLFYTDGTVIYNRNGLVMSNGALFGMLVSYPNLSPTHSTHQAAAIAGMPGNPDRYYVFSLSHAPNYGPYGLYYSIVDMTLSGGMGNVVAGKKLILLDTGMTEKMTVVRGDNCNIWLMTRPRSLNQWWAYEITDTGINTTPVVSTPLNPFPAAEYGTGGIRFSPDRKKMVSYNLGNTIGGLELFDFDPGTGVLSNSIILSTSRYNAACFSPDNSKLYALPVIPRRVQQYDLSLLPNVGAVILSDTLVYTQPGSGSFDDIQWAADGKVYFVGPYPDSAFAVHAINFPNLRGSACQPVRNAIPLLSGTKTYLRLPNNNVVLPLPDTFSSVSDTIVCGAGSLVLQADTAGGRYGHMWSDGVTGSQRTVSTAGTYVVSYAHNCIEYYKDTFHVSFKNFSLSVYADSSCPGMREGSAWMVQADTGIYAYRWTDAGGSVLREQQGSYSDTLTGLIPGTYIIHVLDAASGCDTSLSVQVREKAAPEAAFMVDSVVCIGQPAFLYNLSGAPQWRWDLGDGSTSDSLHLQHTYAQAGTYDVTLAVRNQGGCTDTARQQIQVRDFTVQLYARDTLVKRNTEVTLYTRADETYSVLTWEPSSLFDDLQAYNQRVRVDSYSVYMVIAQSAYGCPDTAYIRLSVMGDIFMPSVFSPNGDGRNDYFRPLHTAHGAQVLIRQLSIFNRWGALVWSGAGKSAERGWDGTHKGVPVETGVYFWTAEFEMADGQGSTQKGDVTLVR
jgi:gliding motility-associated-like protein